MPVVLTLLNIVSYLKHINSHVGKNIYANMRLFIINGRLSLSSPLMKSILPASA